MPSPSNSGSSVSFQPFRAVSPPRFFFALIGIPSQFLAVSSTEHPKLDSENKAQDHKGHPAIKQKNEFISRVELLEPFSHSSSQTQVQVGDSLILWHSFVDLADHAE
jgi:hypothetical protein